MNGITRCFTPSASSAAHHQAQAGEMQFDDPSDQAGFASYGYGARQAPQGQYEQVMA